MTRFFAQKMKIPTITTTRLILRPFTEADAEPLYSILREKDTLRYFPNPNPPSLERVQKFITRQLDHWAEHKYGWWAVEPITRDGLIGWNGLQFLPETGEVEIGYLLSRSYWGSGLATEGARAGLKFGFEIFSLERIIALVHPENKASIRVVEKLGMPFVDRAQYFGMDLNRYAMDRSLFQANQGKF